MSEDPTKKKKKHKKHKKKRQNKSVAKNRQSLNPYSYSINPRIASHNRHESIPHHATVQSLASINQPIIVSQLSKMSQDLKYQRELKKALTELRQKDEDYRYAIEIGESLTKENEYLKEQIEIIESQFQRQDSANATLKEKLETLSSTYHSDLYKYHQELQGNRELVHELRQRLESAKEELILAQRKEMNHRKSGKSAHNTDMNAMHKMMTSADIAQLRSGDFGSNLEKQLYERLDKEQKKGIGREETIQGLMRKLEDLHGLKKKYAGLKKANKELKQFSKDEMVRHLQMQKSIEAEAIYLAAKKANLEEEREDLLELLDQRDYEITMLNQQLALQNNQSMGQTLGDDIGIDNNNNDQYYGYDDMAFEEDDMSDKEEIDIIAEILDDEDLFGDDYRSDTDTNTKEYINEGKTNNETGLKPKPKLRNEKTLQQTKDEKAFDKIKEYLHLTASAVKIKYPTVRDIQSDELIKRAKELPFYKYHDQMVRVMEQQIRNDKRRKGLNSKSGRHKSVSFLSSIFGFGDDREKSEGSDTDKSEEQNDTGITIPESKTDNAVGHAIICTNESIKDRTEIRKEGFLEKKSRIIGKFRKRFVCLNNNNHLLCYKSEQKLELTESIDLGLYKKAVMSDVSKFELIPMSKKEKIRVFSADSLSTAKEWINDINSSMNPLIRMNK